MVATTGLASGIESNVLQYCCAGAAPTALTSPIMLHLATAVSTNAAFGAVSTDANYSAQNAQLAGSTTLTTGSGAAGFQQRSNTVQISFFGAGAAVSQTLTGVELKDSAGTPVNVGYQNFAANVTVGVGATYVVAIGALTFQIS